MRGIIFWLVAISSSVVQANTWYLAPDPRPGGVSEQGVDLASGNLLRSETDLTSVSLFFTRSYPSAGAVDSDFGGWLHTYSRHFDNRKIAYSEYKGLKTPLYSNVATACTEGWNTIRQTAYTGPGAQAGFDGGIPGAGIEGGIITGEGYTGAYAGGGFALGSPVGASGYVTKTEELASFNIYEIKDSITSLFSF
ncbi:MAG: DUF6531 domain-containing protein [Gammaproteobacteria bacterium]